MFAIRKHLSVDNRDFRKKSGKCNYLDYCECVFDLVPFLQFKNT